MTLLCGWCLTNHHHQCRRKYTDDSLCPCYLENPELHVDPPEAIESPEDSDSVPIIDDALPKAITTSTVDSEMKSPTVGDEHNTDNTNKEVAVSDTTEAPVDTEATGATSEAPKERAARTDLEPDVKAVTDAYHLEDLVIEGNKPLTPHRIAAEIAKARGTDNGPSVGAVAAVLDRWAKYEFAVLSDSPKAFVGYTEDGLDKGLSAMKEQHRAAAKEARAAAKAEAAPADEGVDEG